MEAVDRVMRAFTLKHPISDEEPEPVRKDVTEFAAGLLKNTRTSLPAGR